MALFQPVANPIPCFKCIIRSVMVRMKANLHMRVDRAQRDASVECHASCIHGCVMYLLLSHKGVLPLW